MKTIHVVTDIAAPVEVVWAQLSAVSEYAEWNPFITMFVANWSWATSWRFGSPRRVVAS